VRTIAYVDGFNLYFGVLRNSPHRWINLQRLVEMHLMPHNQLIRIKYFTKVKRYILQASPSELCRRRAVRENTH
jgi:hypothetical protein